MSFTTQFLNFEELTNTRYINIHLYGNILNRICAQ